MCGITGALRLSGAGADLGAIVAGMRDGLVHRGPDDLGLYVDDAGALALGFRRLAIIDLSPQGAQPMISASGRYVMCYNGEIYNVQALRDALAAEGAAPAWRGHSDTEVLLAAFAHWGVEEALRRANGMFAVALWDHETRTLYLARDRFGEKPLYYGVSGGTLLFGSELKALRRYPGFNPRIDREALTAFLRYAYVPAPATIYEGVFKLPAGSFLVIRPGSDALPEPQAYWDPARMAANGAAHPIMASDDEYLDRLDALLRQSVGLRMMADVPLGAFLSGGIDSTTIVAQMQAQSSRPVQTFTIGNLQDGYDEAADAKAIARHLGTDHTELYVTARDALDLIPRLPSLYDEPFADSSQLPTFLVCQLARRSVTVALSGDGGDELFGGYNRYFYGPQVAKLSGCLPRPVRLAAAAAIEAASPRTWDSLLRFTGSRELSVRGGEKVHKLAQLMKADGVDGFYKSAVATWRDPARLVLGARGDGEVNLTIPSALTDARQRMMYADMLTYLPGDILMKVDMAAMGCSLETRVPFLDPDVAAFAWALPMEQKIQGSKGKLIVRRLLERYVPAALMDRPKQGFSIPISAWLRSDIRDWAEALLDERRLQAQGYLDPAPVRQAWEQHVSGARDRGAELWTVLMFQAWLDEHGHA